MVEDRNKKNKEKLIIDQFRQDFPEFPKGRLVASESPDFILRISPKHAIGIELVRVTVHNKPGISVFHKIDNIILSKEDKLPLYRKKRLNFYWLLLYTENPGHLTVAEQKWIQDIQVESAYHKIFLMLVPEKAIFAIK